MKLKFSTLIAALTAMTTTAHGQSLTLEELTAKVDERAQTLGGYEDFLMDPDPKRAMAALQVMLESGDDTLVGMALKHGLTSPNADLRWAALKSYLAGKPSLALKVDAAALSDEERALNSADRILRGHGGTLGSNKTGSITVALGDDNTELGCITRRVEKDICAARVNATSISVYLSSVDKYVEPRWVDLDLRENGVLAGSFVGHTTSGSGWKTPPLNVTLKLVE